MTPVQLKAGDFLLILPEDVTQAVGSAFYGVVVSATRSSVRVDSVTESVPGTYSVAKAVARGRGVPRAEAEGSQPGVWLRKAVCVRSGNFHYHGQVVRVEGERLHVSTYLGEKVCSAQQLAGEVYPVIAMIMGSQRWTIRKWSFEDLETVHNQLLDAILEGDAGKPLLSSNLSAILPDLKDRTDHSAEWLVPGSGAVRTTSLDHVLQYVYYVDGKRDIPPSTRAQIGESFCEEPSIPATTEMASDSADSFFEPWEDDDDEGPVEGRAELPAIATTTYGGDGRAAGSYGSQPPAGPSQQSGRSAGNRWDGPDSPSAARLDLEVLELLHKHRPELLAPYLATGASATSRKRSSEPGPSRAPKKARCGFLPTTEQERVHTAVTSHQHQGKSGDAYVDYVLSVAAFAAHPGVASRAYDLQFGKHGLSIMHFKRMGFLDKLRSLAPGTVNMTDYQVAAPRPAPPGSWADLSSSTRSFVDYCRELCDATTVRVAEALDQFVLAMEGWEQLREDELPLLVLWIDATLEKYRGAVLQDLHHGTALRSEAAKWFSMANPEVHSLLFAVLGDRFKRGGHRGWPEQAIQSRGTVESADTRSVYGPRRSAVAERKIPADVVASIPTRDGNEVCLHYLSQRGCNPQDPDRCTYKNRVHFVPTSISPKLRQYINARLGGVCKMLRTA